MPDWIGNLVTALFTAGGMTALFRGYLSVLNARHKNAREARGDEVDVLQQALSQAREDIESLRKDLKERDATWEARWTQRDKDVNDLKSEHTAVLLDLERCRSRDKFLTEQNKALSLRVGQLEAEFRGQPGGG